MSKDDKKPSPRGRPVKNTMPSRFLTRRRTSRGRSCGALPRKNGLPEGGEGQGIQG